MKWQGKRDTAEKTRRPAASSGTIPTEPTTVNPFQFQIGRTRNRALVVSNVSSMCYRKTDSLGMERERGGGSEDRKRLRRRREKPDRYLPGLEAGEGVGYIPSGFEVPGLRFRAEELLVRGLKLEEEPARSPEEVSPNSPWGTHYPQVGELLGARRGKGRGRYLYRVSIIAAFVLRWRICSPGPYFSGEIRHNYTWLKKRALLGRPAETPVTMAAGAVVGLKKDVRLRRSGLLFSRAKCGSRPALKRPFPARAPTFVSLAGRRFFPELHASISRLAFRVTELKLRLSSTLTSGEGTLRGEVLDYLWTTTRAAALPLPAIEPALQDSRPAEPRHNARTVAADAVVSPCLPTPTVWPAVAQRLERSSTINVNRLQFLERSLSDSRDRRRRLSAGFLSDLLLPPPLHSSAAPYSPLFYLVAIDEVSGLSMRPGGLLTGVGEGCTVNCQGGGSASFWPTSPKTRRFRAARASHRLLNCGTDFTLPFPFKTKISSPCDE
ncbi:hypothetical protein PR048_030935 [Dryococelus australis]|uniref:Uncharacterized protein n=1 Tax=Dryococelus australis TaxID=614101 RepID=A0ABQ9GAB1_9NEOP|nr:hypothetical protein PR048_030935 [Dryococelus australis]